MPATTRTPRVKVACSDTGCGWSGERVDDPHLETRRCPWCHLYSVVRVGRTPNPTLTLVALARARLTEERST